MSEAQVRIARMVNCIYVVFIRGAGTERDPVREVQQWWATDGDMISERDNWKTEHDNE